MTHQELFNNYARCRVSVMWERENSSVYPDIFMEIAIYAHENGLEFPDALYPYSIDEDGFIDIDFM